MNFILTLVLAAALVLVVNPALSEEAGSGQAKVKIISDATDPQAPKRKTVLLFPLWDAGLAIDESFKQEILNSLGAASAKASRFKLMQMSQFIGEAFPEEEVNSLTLSREKLIEKSKLLGVDEIFLVKSVSFSQIGVAPEEDEETHGKSFWRQVSHSLFDVFFWGTTDTQFPNNIQTELVVGVVRINVSNGDTLDNIYYEGVYTGGDRAKSKVKTMALFEVDVIAKISSLYIIDGVGYAESRRYMLIKKGRLDGVKSSTLFNVFDHDKSITLAGKSVDSPGQRVAIAKAVDVSGNTTRLKIVRRWGEINETSKIVENKSRLYSLNLLSSKNIDNSAVKFGFEAMFAPFSSFDYGFGLKYMRVDDTRNEVTQGPSIDAIAALHFLRSDLVSLSLQSGVNLSVFFRTDDARNSVSSAIFGVPLFLNIEHKFNKSWNAFVSLGYQFSNKNATWEGSKNTGKVDKEGKSISTNFPAVWNGSAPAIDVSGAYIRLGMKKYIF